MVEQSTPLDENDMKEAYNTIAEARTFLEKVVALGSRKIGAGISGKCPVCGCGSGYGHSLKCEQFLMETRASPLSRDLTLTLKMFGRMEAIIMEGTPED